MDQHLAERLFTTGLAALVVVNSDDVIVSINPAACERLGLTPSDPLPACPFGRGEWPLCGPDGTPLDPDQLPAARVRAEGGVHEALVRYDTTGGVRRTLHLRAERVDDGTQGFPLVGYAITDRTREDAVSEERLRFLQVMEATPDYVIMTNTDQEVTYLNPAVRALVTGSAYRPGPASLIELFADHPDGDPVKPVIEHALATARAQGSWQGEAMLLAASGKPVEVLLTFLAHPTDSGGVEDYTVFARDISQRRLLESELRGERGLHEAIIDGLPGIYYFLDHRGHFLRWNRNLQEVSGYSAEEIASMNAIQLWAEADHPTVKSSTREAHRSGSGQIEARLVTRDGRHLPYLLTGTRMLSDGKSFLSAFGTDISLRREMEQRLQSTAEVFEHIREGVLIADGRLGLLQSNRAFSERTHGAFRQASTLTEILDAVAGPANVSTAVIWDGVARQGLWTGEITLQAEGVDPVEQWLTLSAVRDQDGRRVRYIAVFSDITELKRSRERLQYQANHDALTGLPNRALFRARIEQAAGRASRSGGRLALAFLDLDRFRDINNSLGHDAGDELLIEIARRLQRTVRAGDTVARLGANQFGVCIEQLRSSESAYTQASRLASAIAEPIQVGQQALRCSCSTGISTYPHDAQDVDVLIRHADTAMHDAKSAGRNTIRFYTDELTRRAARRLDLAQQLRRGLEEDRFVLYYQTQMRLPEQQVAGVEALVRYQHPEEGLLSPGQFIAVAEEAGLICELGEWILNAACLRARQWLDEGREFGRVAVNVSAQQVQEGRLAETVEGALSRTGLPAERLELEVTESAFMAFTDTILESLQRIRKLGVRLTIDDFGTGYSSLLYLKRLPVQCLKIDRGFVHDMDSSAESRGIVNTIVGLARNLELDLVAEGVETHGQAAMLQSYEPIVGQGFLWSRPVPEPELPHATELKPGSRDSYTSDQSTA